MGTKSFVYGFFPLFLQLRARTLPNEGDVIKWVSKISFFIQASLVALLSIKPSLMMGLTNGSSTSAHFLNCVLAVQWFSEPKFVLYDSVTYIVLDLMCITLLFVSKRMIDKGKIIKSFQLSMINLIMILIPGMLSIPLYFKLALAIDMFIDNFQVLLIIPLVLINIAIILTFYIEYLSSIFLETYIISIRSVFDMHESKTGTIRQVVVCIQVVLSFILQANYSYIVNYVFIVVTITVGALDFYIRILPFNYTSNIANFLDNSFSIIIPIISAIRAQTKIQHYLVIILYCIILILFILALKLSLKYLSSKTNDMINLLINNSHKTSLNRSTLTPFNFVAMIRCAAIVNPSPAIYDKLIEMQHMYNRRGAVVIEIARGISVYPSRRHQALEEIEITHSKSIHNSFVLYTITDRINSLLKGSSKTDRMHVLYLHRDFADTIQKYYKARLDKSAIGSFKYGLAAFATGRMMTHEGKLLVERFPFDTSVRKLYVECLMISNSDAPEIQNQVNILREMRNKGSITDPILHSAVKTHPNFLKYLSEDEVRQCSAVTPMRIKPGAEERRPAWTFISRGERHYVPFVVLFHVLPSVVFAVFCGMICGYERTRDRLSIKTDNRAVETVYDFFLSEASMFLPFAHHSINVTLESVKGLKPMECQTRLLDTLMNMLVYYDKIPNVGALTPFTLPLTTSFFRDVINRTSSFCGLLEDFLVYSNQNKYTNLTTTSLKEMYNILIDRINLHNDHSRFIFFAIALPAALVVSALLFVGGVMWRFSRSLPHFRDYFAYMASDERAELVRRGRGGEAWDMLYDIMEVEAEGQIVKDDKSDDFDFERISKECHPTAVYFILTAILWATNIILFILAAISHTYRIGKEYSSVVHLETTFELTYTAVQLQDYVANIVLGSEERNATMIEEVLESFESHPGHALTELFNKNRTFGKVNASVHEMILLMMDEESYEELGLNFWVDTFLPVFFTFSRECIVGNFAVEASFGDPNDDLAYISFGIQIAFWILVELLWGIASSIAFSNFYKVINQFPIRFVEMHMHQQPPKPPKDDLGADNVLVIKSVTETGAIYSVSETAGAILGKRPDTFINQPIDDIFTETPCEVPLVTTNEKKGQKTFRVQHEIIGPIKRSLYVDDSTKVMGGSSVDTTITSQLTPYMPLYFAERFLADVSTNISIENSFFMILRLVDGPPQTIDRFFGSFAMITNQFKSMQTINMDMDVITCVLADHLSRTEAVLITREVVMKIGANLHSAELVFIEKSDFEVIVEGEPFIDIKPGELKDSERRIYRQPQKTLAASKIVGCSSWKNSQEWEGLDLIPIESFVISAMRM